MKKLLILLFSLLISFNSYGELKEYNDIFSGAGWTHYIKMDTIKEDERYVYYWKLIVLDEPTETGTFKIEKYYQGDCVVYRYSELAGVWYRKWGERRSSESYDLDWEYPFPDSPKGIMLSYVCDYVD